MKKMRLWKGMMAVILSCFFALGSAKLLFGNSLPDGGTIASICHNESAVINRIKDDYDNLDTRRITVTKSASKRIKTTNVSQSELFEHYNNTHKGNPITDRRGICWAAAQTSVLKYAGASSTIKAVGNGVIEKAMQMGWVTTVDSGFDFTHADTLMNAMFNRFGMKKKANNDRYDIYVALRDEIDQNRAVIFKIIEHEMTGCGYQEYTVNYEERNLFGNWKSKSGTSKFVIVNTTWGDVSNSAFAYFPEDDIGTGFFTRWDFGITKYENK